MGWKNVKEYYRIEHAVQVTDAGICIGSPYIHNLIVIGLDGTLAKRDDGRCNEELRRYMAEFDADPQTLKRMVVTPDTFEKSVTVYTYDDGEILEKQCEVLGWPNVTHDGQMMYDNTHWTDRAKAVARARSNAEAWVRSCKERVATKAKELADSETMLASWEANVRKLAAI